jgi:hypothetical protein
MEATPNHIEPGSAGEGPTGSNPFPTLLTVAQAYDYLITEGLPRSKKTIRKWCRLNHVDRTDNVIPGGPKWLITRSSLDARIAEERLIDASLTRGTGANRSEPVQSQTGADGFAPLRDDELVQVLKEQLVHERETRKTAERKTGELLAMYHEIALASTQFGIEIAKGMQEQGRARRLGEVSEAGARASDDVQPGERIVDAETEIPPGSSIQVRPETRDGDNPALDSGASTLQ